jgi:hypothetical protein
LITISESGCPLTEVPKNVATLLCYLSTATQYIADWLSSLT